MSDNSKQPLIDYVVRLGDDAIVIGQRLTEWCSNAPFLEEDLAIANTALDFIGRARMLYAYAAELSGDGKTEDSFAFTRDCRDFRNKLIYELPRGDFAYTYARQFVIDAYDTLFFEALMASKDERLAAIAAKAIKESRYHLRHSAEWLCRLGDGTEESSERMQRGLDGVWDFVGELFEDDELDQQMVEQGIGVCNAALREQWNAIVKDVLDSATVTQPEPSDWHQSGGRTGFHTEHLGHLLSELQFMQRAYPGLEW